MANGPVGESDGMNANHERDTCIREAENVS